MPQSCHCLQGARVLSFIICKMGGLEENAGAFSIVTIGGSHLLACIQTVVRDAVGTACTMKQCLVQMRTVPRGEVRANDNLLLCARHCPKCFAYTSSGDAYLPMG